MGFYTLAKSRLPNVSVDEVTFGEGEESKTISTSNAVELAEHEVALLKKLGHDIIEQPAPDEVVESDSSASDSEQPAGDDISESPLQEEQKPVAPNPMVRFGKSQQPAKPESGSTEALS